jgi:hypothetical protein
MRRLDFSASERQQRSRIAQISTHKRLIRGSLTVRKNSCGKANCRCARGEPHLALYITQSHDGKPRQLFVPKGWEERVRHAVSDYQELQRLVEELSETEWKHLENREG